MQRPPRATRMLTPLLLAAGACGVATSPGGEAGIRVTVEPASARVVTGSTVPFTSAVSGTIDVGVLWSVREGSCGTVSPPASTGPALYSAPPVTAICHVVATSAADTTKSATATVTVTDPGPPPALAISPNPAAVPLGGTLQFTVAPASAVTWNVVESPASAAPPAYPLRVSANGRYLEDQTGHPWRIQAEAASHMSVKGTSATVDAYLADRKARGFNAFYLKAMVHQGGYASAPNAPNDANGDPPFTTPGNFLTPNEPYWTWIDTIIDKAAAQGMVVMLAYTYLGYQSSLQGWWSELAAMTQANATTWGAWLGNRYKNKANVIWYAVGDQTPSAGSALERNVVATINGIKSTGANQLFVAEFAPNDSIPSTASAAIGPYIDLSSYYGYGAGGQYTTYETAMRAYSFSSPRPVWVLESGFEYQDNTGQLSGQDTSWATRRTRLWNSLGGGTAGDGFGTNDVWGWNSGASNWPDTPGSTYSGHAFNLFASIPWWKLVPSQKTGSPAYTGCGKVLVTSGQGAWGSTSWISASVTSDGQWMLVYNPGTSNGTAATTFSVDMSALTAAPTATARWWNPGTGARTIIGTYSTTGTQSFTTPGSNGSGNDWVLVLDATPASRCGSISASGLYTAPALAPAGVVCQVTATLQSDPAVVATATVNLQ